MTGVTAPIPASQADVDAVKAQAAAADAKASAADNKAAAAGTKADAAMTKADQAIADGLTGADRQQALRIQVTPDANGRFVFTYPKAYATGIKPAVTTTAETPDGAAYRNDASLIEGSATNTQVTIIVQRIPKTLVASVLGAVLNVFTPVTTPVWVNILVRAPV